MKANKFFLGLATMAVAGFAFSSCASDDDMESALQRDNARAITFTSSLATTRATADPQSGTSLSTSSALAVWAINGSTALTNGNNEQYSVDGSGNLAPVTTANTMEWPDGATLNFYAYAPYSSSYSYNTANSFTVQADQSSSTSYLGSDLVLAQALNKTYNSSAVTLSFHHLLSKINITINKASGATVDLSKATVTIMNTLPTITFNPSATDGEDDKILGTASGTATDITAVSALGDATTACAIIVPQTIASGTALVKIETGSEATSGANRTLIARLGSSTTFASGQSYSFTVTVSDLTEPTTEPDYVTLVAGSENLVQWTDNALGGSATEVYVAGDYVLKDGSLVHKENLTEAQKAYVRAIVFTNGVEDLSAEDQTAGYVGYAMSIVRMGNKKWLDSSTLYETAPDSFEASLAKLNGSTRTSSLQTAWNIEANSSTWGDAFVNFTNFTSSSNPLESSALVGAASGNRNLSGWFAPAFGQMIQILNNLGNAGITSETTVSWSNSSSDIYTGTADPTTTINALVTTGLGKTEGPLKIDSSNDIIYTTVTEASASNFFLLRITKESGAIGIGKGGGKGTGGRSVLPIVAFKLPVTD